MKLPERFVNGVERKKPDAMGGFGQGMLERMGWSKGEGLGKARQGRPAPIEVKKKDNTKGLGEKLGWDWGHDYAGSAYDQALAGIAGAGDSASSSSDESTDEEQADCLRNCDGTSSSGTAAELRLARTLARDNHLGRFGGRSGKLARIREQEAQMAAAALTAAAAAGSTQMATQRTARNDCRSCSSAACNCRGGAER